MFRMRKGEELKTPHYASAAALRDDRLPHSQQGLSSNINSVLSIDGQINRETKLDIRTVFKALY